MRKSNYEITKENTQGEFLKYDQQKMIERFSLENDEDYLYITFIGRNYRIGRKTGQVEGRTVAGEYLAAGFNETMSIFDVLCDSKEDCCLSGEFATWESLKGTVYSSVPGGNMFDEMIGYFDRRPQELKGACETLGGTPCRIGDISYQIQIFDFLPMQLQFWRSDDEFPASLKLLWDRNILDYMRYETTFYVAIYLLQVIREIMEREI